MKPAEYVKKYGIDRSTHFDTKMFVEEFFDDMCGNSDLTFNKSHSIYESWLDNVRRKWDAIFNKSILKTDQSDKIWKYLYAAKIIPLRDSVFGDYKAAKHNQKMKYDKSYRNAYHRSQERKQYEKDWNDHFSKVFDNFLSKFLDINPPVESLAYLQLTSDNLTIDNVNSQFRKLSFKMHPDAGGSAEQFRKLINHKETLLKFLQSKTGAV